MELGESVKESGGNSTVDSTGGSVSEASVDSVVNVIDMTLTEGSPLLAGGEWNNFLQLPHCTPSSVEYLNNDFLNELEARKSKQELKIFRNAWLVEFQNTSQHESNEAQTDHEEVHKVMVISLALAGKYSLLFPSKKSKGSLPLTDLEENMSLQSLSAKSSVDDLCSDLLDEKLTGKSKEGPLKTAMFGLIVTFVSNANGSEDEIQIKDEKKDKQLMESLLAACQGRDTEKKKDTTSLRSHNECIQYMSYDCQLTSEGKVRSRQPPPPPPGGSSNPSTHPSIHSSSAAAVAGGASTEVSATSFHQNCKLFNSTNASSLDHTHLSVYSASAAGDCLHFTETFTNNLSEDVTSRLPVKEEEEKGSVEVFTNSLADLQSSVFGRSDLYTDPVPVLLHSLLPPPDECCTVIMATNKYSRSLLPIGSRVSCPSRVSSVWRRAGTTRGLTVVYGGEEFTAVQSSAPHPHLETWSSLHHDNIQELSAVLGDCPLHRETTYLLTPKRPSECVRSLMEIMLSTSSIISRLSSSANNKEKELILKNMQSVLLEVLSGLSFLHSQGLVYGQLSMQNILLDMRCGCGDVFLCPHEDRDSYRVYLADLSKVASEEEGGLSQQDDVTLFGWMLEELMFGLDAAVEFQVVERECPELKGLYKVYLSCVQTSSDEVATVQKLVQDLGHLDTTIPPPSPTGNVGTTILSSTSTKDDVQTTISSPSSTEDDEQTTISSPSSTKDDVQTTISSPRSTRDDVQTTILSPSSTKDNVQTTTSSPRSTGGVVLIPPPPPLKGGGVYSGQQETAQENGKEFNAKMIVGHFSSLPKNAVVPTGGDKPFYFGQSVLGFFSVAVPPVPAHEGSEGSSNMIAVVSDKKMDQKEIARGRSTLERDEYLALLYEQRKDDTMEPPPPEGKIIFSTCAEFTEGSVLPLPSAAAMADGIGKGGNGVVSYVYHMGKEFAVKETCLREEEMRTLSKLSGQASRNVLPISAVMEGPPLDRYHGRRACYQLMPRATGDVRQMLDRSGSPALCHYFFKYKPEPAKSFCVLANTRVVLRQALRGLQHLHSKGIVHRDVKLQNILLDMRCGCGDVFLCPHKGRDSYRVYLADFDSALDVERARGRLEERARKGGSVLRFTPYGTQGYRAPETSFFYCSNQVLSPEPLFLATRMVLGSALTPYLNPAQDLWSFGCTVLKLFVGATGPTSQKEVASVLLADCLRRSTQSSSRYQHSVHGRLTVDDEEMKKLLKVSSVKPVFPLAVELQDLIRQCLQVDPHLRPSAKQCANLPFFKPIDPATDKNSYPSEPRQDTPAVELPYRTRATHGDQSSHSEPEGLQGSPESVLSPKSSNGGNTGPPSSTPPVVQMQSRSTSCGRPQDPNEHNSLRGVKSKQLKNDDKQGPGAIGPRSVNSPKSSNGGNTGPPSSTPPVVDPKNRPFAAALLEHPYLNQQGSTLPSAGSGGAEVPPPQSISVQSTQQLSPLTIEHSHAQPQLEASTEDVPMNSCSTSCGRPQDPNEHNSLCGVKVPMNSCSTSCGRPQDPNEHNSLRGVKSNQLKNDDKQGLEAIGLRSVNSPKSSNGGNTGPPSSTPPVPTYLVDKPRHAVSGASGN